MEISEELIGEERGLRYVITGQEKRSRRRPNAFQLAHRRNRFNCIAVMGFVYSEGIFCRLPNLRNGILRN